MKYTVHSGLLLVLPLLHYAVNVYVPQNLTTVLVYSNETEVELFCEMTDFIRSDEDLRWFKDNHMILTVDGTNRYTVTYRDATPNAAQTGGNGKVPSRASVLAIANPSPSDSGSYSCRVEETSVQSADIHLIVTSPTNTTQGYTQDHTCQGTDFLSGNENSTGHCLNSAAVLTR